MFQCLFRTLLKPWNSGNKTVAVEPHNQLGADAAASLARVRMKRLLLECNVPLAEHAIVCL